jgi:hypothetical protein
METAQKASGLRLHQRFQLKPTSDGKYQIIDRNSRRCLDAHSIDEIDITLTPCESPGGAYFNLQEFRFVADPAGGPGYHIKTAANTFVKAQSGKLVEGAMGLNTLWYLSDTYTDLPATMKQVIGTSLDVHEASFKLKNASVQSYVTGSYDFKKAGTVSGRQLYKLQSGTNCLDVEGASLEPGAAVTNYPCHGGDNQKFQIVQLTNGYGLVALHSDLYVALDGPAGALIQQVPKAPWILETQKFSFNTPREAMGASTSILVRDYWCSNGMTLVSVDPDWESKVGWQLRYDNIGDGTTPTKGFGEPGVWGKWGHGYPHDDPHTGVYTTVYYHHAVDDSIDIDYVQLRLYCAL